MQRAVISCPAMLVVLCGMTGPCGTSQPCSTGDPVAQQLAGRPLVQPVTDLAVGETQTVYLHFPRLLISPRADLAAIGGPSSVTFTVSTVSTSYFEGSAEVTPDSDGVKTIRFFEGADVLDARCYVTAVEVLGRGTATVQQPPLGEPGQDNTQTADNLPENAKKNPANGHSYVVSDQKMSWFSATSWAENMGGHLVSINDQAEQEWIVTNYPDALGAIWIGYRQSASGSEPDGGWGWVQGGGGFSFWQDNKPDNGAQGEDCAVIQIGDFPRGDWDDKDCSRYFYALAEIS